MKLMSDMLTYFSSNVNELKIMCLQNVNLYLWLTLGLSVYFLGKETPKIVCSGISEIHILKIVAFGLY